MTEQCFCLLNINYRLHIVTHGFYVTCIYVLLRELYFKYDVIGHTIIHVCVKTQLNPA